MGILLVGYEAGTLPEMLLDQIQEIVPDMQVIITKDRDKIEDLLEDLEIAMWNFPRDLILKSPNLRWYQQWGAGANWLMKYPEIIEKDVVITNTSGIHAIPISEHIFALVLAFARALRLVAFPSQSQHRWQGATQAELFELAGKTMVLIGVGAIGERTAKIAEVLGMRVLGIRYNPTKTIPAIEAMYGPDQLLNILPEADCVVLTVPLTHETHRMIGEQELRAMKPAAYIINIGRGETIDEKTLITALQEGWIAGAGLDVFEQEPLPQDSPLWDMENVIITAHYAGWNPYYNERALEIFLKNLRLYKAGKPLFNVVDKNLGY